MHLLSAFRVAIFLEFTCAVPGGCWVPEEGGNGPASVLPPELCLLPCTAGTAENAGNQFTKELHRYWSCSSGMIAAYTEDRESNIIRKNNFWWKLVC